ncbi:unnamed protein product [Tilletia laevis]|uniref:Transposase n=2 Tax=Tilletia TaxID=13289 RepID=A0A177TUT1_9BASI|nr:hypothetical protein CF336_g7074 [Tilletia laevis]KAE8249413.1 hypothetical protein A4X03_0g6613 [Tilletia caries]KAE8189948.1 hypothetical protein CF335_g6490 [Tilletia laevis]CAD6925735.1 unnamed protein product [Tilletia caries]CAD6936955.1 unnamed protein product [Tilletia caries]
MPYRRIEHSSKELLIKLYVEGFLTRDEVLAVGVFSNATLHRSLKKWNGTGLPQRLHSTGRPRKLGTEDIAYVLERLDQCADLMLDELASNIRSVGGPQVSKSLLSRTLQRLDITRKRVKRRALEADLDQEAACRLRMARYLPEQLIFVDESGFDSRTAHRRYGWAPAGHRAVQTGTGKRAKQSHTDPGPDDWWNHRTQDLPLNRKRGCLLRLSDSASAAAHDAVPRTWIRHRHGQRSFSPIPQDQAARQAFWMQN